MKARPSLRSRAGFTLIEVIISFTILTVVIGSVMGIVVSIQRTFVNQRERTRAHESLRAAQLIVATVLRSAGANPLGTAPTLLDPDPLNHNRFGSLRVVSDFNADGLVTDDLEDVLVEVDSDTLFIRWKAGAQRQAVAFPVTDILFEYYATDGTLMTTAAQIVGATRAKFTVEAPSDPRTGGKESIETWWIYLRNRT